MKAQNGYVLSANCKVQSYHSDLPLKTYKVAIGGTPKS